MRVDRVGSADLRIGPDLSQNPYTEWLIMFHLPRMKATKTALGILFNRIRAALKEE
jgi:hypothetical protein